MTLTSIKKLATNEVIATVATKKKLLSSKNLSVQALDTTTNEFHNKRQKIIMMITWKIAVDSSLVASPTKLVSLGWLERPPRSHLALLRPTTNNTGK